MNAAEVDFDNLIEHMKNYDFFEIEASDRIPLMNDKENIIRKLYLYEFLAQKYNVVITNPPYMGTSGMNAELSDYVKTNYPDSKSDLFAVFIEKCLQMTKSNFYTAMITQHAFMFLSSYEKLRSKLLLNDFVNMAHLGARAFEEIGGEVVQTTSFAIRQTDIFDYNATYCGLLNYGSQKDKEMAYLKKDKNDLFYSDKNTFFRLPNHTFAYWVSTSLLTAFENNKKLLFYGSPKQGFATGDNNRFLRLWYEVEFTQIGFKMPTREIAIESKRKWFPCNKGGSYRKWYGNNDYVVNWENDGFEIRNFKDEKGKLRSRPQNMDRYFQEGLTWSTIANALSMRYSPMGFLFETKGSVCFVNNPANKWYLLGLLNCKIVEKVLLILSPTLDYHEGPLGKIPVIIDDKCKEKINNIVLWNVKESKIDWDSFETSWDFQVHPLAKWGLDIMRKYSQGTLFSCSIEGAYGSWASFTEQQFAKLKSNEEDLNRIFINIYGLQDELTPEVKKRM